MGPFFERVAARQQRLGTRLCLGLDPRPDYLQPEDLAADNPLAAWGERLLRACADTLCCVKPNSGFYEAHGVDGWRALAHTIAVAHELGIPVLLDAKRGDIGSTAEAYARAAFEGLGADAITLSPYLGRDSIEPFLSYEGRGLFVLCHTSNPGAEDFQTLPVGGRPLYERVARRAAGWDGRVGLVVGATFPDAIRRVRAVAPESWLLLPGVGAQGGDAAAALAAGGERVVVPISRAIIGADDPAAAARALCDQIQQAATPVAVTSEDGLAPDLAALTESLVEMGALRFGEFTLSSGKQSPIYIDLRLLAARPAVLEAAAHAYAARAAGLTYDVVAALPYAALPIGTAVALVTGDPLIYPRKESKSYGTKRAIEGRYEAGQRALLLDDLVTTGGTKVEGAAPLRDAGLVVEDILVLIDRSGGRAAPELAEHGMRLHSVMTLEGMMDHLAAGGRLDEAVVGRVRRFLAEG